MNCRYHIPALGHWCPSWHHQGITRYIIHKIDGLVQKRHWNYVFLALTHQDDRLQSASEHQELTLTLWHHQDLSEWRYKICSFCTLYKTAMDHSWLPPVQGFPRPPSQWSLLPWPGGWLVVERCEEIVHSLACPAPVCIGLYAGSPLLTEIYTVLTPWPLGDEVIILNM